MMFFKQMLLVFLIQQMAAGIFRLIAGVCRTMIISNTADMPLQAAHDIGESLQEKLETLPDIEQPFSSS
ncbi:hypothetical protein F0562_012461 [Nyssa sinensis]|uniref:Uncharacterized protein n=1 Tax=Nyssa sinensis TaxID=561372 RepID=A0A5J4ZVY9_9ASTE|nr:hypothetical protein F0562_012461 [Nyssa sinensis]